jgi:hypothetical protein
MSWTEEADKRNCYCGVWDTNPAAFEAEGYPVGFCGMCEVCGAPGHTRHHPGPVPYTGCWCDPHYAKEEARAANRRVKRKIKPKSKSMKRSKSEVKRLRD